MVGDVFTVGIVLLLLIGAVAFYLYTRIAQVEKHMNLLESILLDLKVATENSFLGFPMPMMSGGGKSGGHAPSSPKSLDEEDDEQELLSEYVPKMPTARIASTEEEELAIDELENDTDMYEKILESAAVDAGELEETELEEADAEVAEAETRSVAIEGDATTLPEATRVGEEVHVNKVEPNYESLSVKELKELAKARGIAGASKLGRRDILEALRKKDNGVEDGVSSTLADYGFGSSLEAGAAAIDA